MARCESSQEERLYEISTPLFGKLYLNGRCFTFSKAIKFSEQTTSHTFVHPPKLSSNYVWTWQGKDCRQEVCQPLNQGRAAGVHCLPFCLIYQGPAVIKF